MVATRRCEALCTQSEQELSAAFTPGSDGCGQARRGVIAEGSAGAVMYVVRSGTVGVKVNDTLVEEIGEGGIFGEMALIDQSKRSAEIVAVSDAVVVMVNEKKFLALTGKIPHFALMVMRALTRRIRKMNALLAERAYAAPSMDY